MIEFFGGNLVEVVLGGAALNADVKFLRKIRFPYSVGYGMTECAPYLLSPFCTRFRSAPAARWSTGCG